MPIHRESTNISGKLVPNILMVGSGHYTTGWVKGQQNKSDKKIGVIAPVLFDQRRLGNVGNLSMVGTNGTRFPEIRSHLEEHVAQVYRDMDTSFRSFPNDDVKSNPLAYLEAMETLHPGDAVIITTPDDTHFKIAKTAIEKSLQFLITKPPVKTLKEHLELINIAKQHDVLGAVDVHKRYDTVYADARQQIRGQLQKHGRFTSLQAHMTIEKKRLDHVPWAGKSSDVSYYLNSHHIDWHVWTMEDIARPVKVYATAAQGIANNPPHNLPTEDMIILTVDWENFSDPKNNGIAVYIAGWVDPTSDVYTEQGFKINVPGYKIDADQSRRGYMTSEDGPGIKSLNPFYMKYTPNEGGYFDSSGYGCLCIAAFIEAIGQILNKQKTVKDYDKTLPTIARTTQMTAILEAGRESLDAGGVPVSIKYDKKDKSLPVGLTKYKLLRTRK